MREVAAESQHLPGSRVRRRPCRRRFAGDAFVDLIELGRNRVVRAARVAALQHVRARTDRLRLQVPPAANADGISRETTL